MIDYQKLILEKIALKAERRKNEGRRVFVRPRELYKDYASYNADIEKKREIALACDYLESRGIITVDRISFSEDVDRIALVEGRIDDVLGMLHDEYGITGGETSEQKRHREDVDRMVSFVKNNIKDLYIREASMLVYGDSKHFEQETIGDVCRMLAGDVAEERNQRVDGTYEATADIRMLQADLYNILEKYHIYPGAKEIRVKGRWVLVWDNQRIEVDKIPGGMSITTDGLEKLLSIETGGVVMTIENKTAFDRMPEDGRSYVYLGGFAGRGQGSFLRKVYGMNPSAKYLHFGDIDVGGLLIHRNLCELTEIPFEMYRMGVAELSDGRYAGCLKELTERDLFRMETIGDMQQYEEVVGYMREHGVKLEQEIVALYE